MAETTPPDNDPKEPGKGPGKEWWNKVSGLAGKILRPAGEAKSKSDEEPVLTLDQRRMLALDALRSLLTGKKGTAALALYHKTVHACESWELPEKELLQLTELVCDESSGWPLFRCSKIICNDLPAAWCKCGSSSQKS